jgi:drug/metabolite transporter (DMT)-like permease
MLVALFGVTLDAIGIILTRLGFESNPELSPIWANFIRCFGATFLFILLIKKNPLHLKVNFLSLSHKVKFLFISGSLLGTFLSLLFYLNAVKFGHLATLSGISLTTPLFATIFERVFFKKPLTRYILFSFVFFALGLFFITIYV